MTGSDEPSPILESAVDAPPGEGSASGSHRGSSAIPAVPALPAAAAADSAREPSGGHPMPELPDFRLLAKIGQGGFGSVWIAQHRHTGDAVAIKFIAPGSREVELKGLQHLRQRVREGQEHLVWPEYIGEAADFIYCVMDLADPVVDGPLFADRYEALTLLKYAKQKGRLDLLEAANVTLSVAKGLAYLQAAGLRHGDIKPANILRVRGKWKLIDYGMMGGLEAKARGGTRSYLPPEGPHGDRADQFALGIVLYELVFGHRPNANAREPWPESRLASGLRRVQQRLTEPDPDRRFASSAEVVQELESLLSTSKPTATGAAGACPSCGEPIFGSEEACGSCGSELWRQCPVCQHRGSIVQRYCTQCRGPVHGIFAMRSELNEADALLCDGVHRESLQRIEGPLRDLLQEVAHDLAKLHGGDLSRRRRVEAIEAEFEGRLNRMADRCRLLQQIDARIADAHERADVMVLRDSIARALEIVPGASTYERLRADLPLLEARSRWTALLGRLGNPQSEPSKLSSERLRTVISTLRSNLPEQAVARDEAKVVLATLQDEQRNRIRDRCRVAAAWHEREGRPLPALRWLRIAESKHAADRSMKESIDRLVAELKPLAKQLREVGRQALQQSGGHRQMRRIASELSVIEGSGSEVAAKLRAEWPRRRRIDLLRRIANRSLSCVSRGQFVAADAMLGMAHRISDGDPAVRDRVIDLDNSIAARIRTVRELLGAAIAEEATRPERALQLLEQAAQIAPEWDEVALRLGRAREAAAVVPIRRRRRFLVTSLALIMLAAVAAVGSYHVITLAPLRSASVALAEAVGPASAEARKGAIDLLSDPRRQEAWLLTDLGLVDEVHREWGSSWSRTYGTEGTLSREFALAGAEELSAWRGLDDRAAASDWLDAATLRLITGVLAARATRIDRVATWRDAIEVAARSDADVGLSVDLVRPELAALLAEPVAPVALATSLQALEALSTTLDPHPEARELLGLVADARGRWCDASVRELRAELNESAARALRPGEVLGEGASIDSANLHSDCGEEMTAVATALSRLREERTWATVRVDFADAAAKVGSGDGGGTVLGATLLLIPIATSDGIVLAAADPLSNDAWRSIVGDRTDSVAEDFRVDLSIDEAWGFCEKLPHFAWLGRRWRAVVPGAEAWGAAWRARSIAESLRFNIEFDEWVAGALDRSGPRVAIPRTGGLRPVAAGGDSLTVFRPFFEAIDPADGPVDPVWFELASQSDFSLANSGDLLP